MPILQHHPIFGRHLVRQFAKFTMVGVTNTVIDFLVYSGLIFLAHVHYVPAKTVAFIVAVSWSYALNRRWTFRSDDMAWKRQMVKFYLVTLVGFGLTLGLLWMVVDVIHPAARLGLEVKKFDELAGYVVATGLAMIWNFFGNRYWTFAQRPKALAS